MKLADVKKTCDDPLPRRIVVYGTHGIGKSTWAACSPSPIFIPTEDGLQDIPAMAFPVARSLADVIEAMTELATQAHEFKTAVIDSADWLERLVWQQVCDDGKKPSIGDFGYGKGYDSAATKFRELLNGLDYLRNEKRMQVILLAHCKVTNFKSPDTEAYNRYTPKLHELTAGLLQEWADEVLFANYKVYTRTDGKGFDERKLATGGDRVLYTTERPSHLAKNRLQLPPEIPFVYSTFHELMQSSQARRAAEMPF